jgi:antitoxin (DNA-binding transcriptional repressor) of toxin-antitoxin stability system
MPKPKTVNLYEAKTHLSKLVEEASEGAEIIIAKSGTAKAQADPAGETRKDRKPGGWEGRVWISDDFDDELPRDLLAGFLGDEEGVE